MSPSDITLMPFYEGWRWYQTLLIQAITPLTPEQLDLRAAPQQWSVSILLRHVVSARIGWFHEWMGEGSIALEKYNFWEDDADARPTANELIQGLEATWQMIEAALQRWTIADMGQSFHNPWNPDRPDRTRQWIIWHVLEHDLHHGGEVSLILGAHGLAGIDI